MYVPATAPGTTRTSDDIYPGWHGWSDLDPDCDDSQYGEGAFPDMRAIFMARGPAFR